jgi:hypothetical protein
MTYYDDNFGHWEIESQEDVEFYHQVQRESRPTICRQCDRRVLLRPSYNLCNSCAEANERGYCY